MFGLKPNADFSFLTGQTLIQICFGEHDLILHFDGGFSGAATAISITSLISLQLPESEQYEWEDFRQGAGFLVALVSNKVAKADGTTDGTLTIEFCEGGVLKIYDNSKRYESYSVGHGDKLIVV